MLKRSLIARNKAALLRTSLFAATFSLSVALPAALNVNWAIAAPQVGTSAGVRGEVFVTTSGAQRRTQVRDAIKLQDKVLTKNDSALQILLLDRTTFTVGQNASVVIDRFVYDPGTTSGQISARVAKGAFRFMSGRIGKNNPTNATVTTPSATIGIRGTFFEGIVGEDAVALAQLGGIDTSGASLTQASITILRGPGRNRNTIDETGIIDVSNGAGTVRLIQPGYAVFTASENSQPVGPFKVTPEMQAYLDFFLRSEPSGESDNPIVLPKEGEKAAGQDIFEIPSITTDDIVEDAEAGITDPNQIEEEYDEGVENEYDEGGDNEYDYDVCNEC